MADVEQEGQEQADLAQRPVNRSGRGGRVPIGCIKKQRHYLLTKLYTIKTIVLPLVRYECES